LLLIPILVYLVSAAHAQRPALSPHDAERGAPRQKHLTAVETVLGAEVANALLPPLRCDAKGNFYVQTEPYGVSTLHKLGPKGERLSLFKSDSDATLKVLAAPYFALSSDGDVYQLVLSADITRYMLVFRADGSYRRTIKLDPGFAWMPSAFLPLQSGNLLMTGQEYDRDPQKARWPFTGIFSSDGKLLKELKLEGDEEIRQLGVRGDSRVTGPEDPGNNRAVGFSQIEMAGDGNVYLMRWLSPAIIYGISPGGEVVRHFTVDPGDQNYRPAAMHISGNRIAILFYQPQTMAEVMRVVDLEGNELATYDEDSNDTKSLGHLGIAYACYTSTSERFTFLGIGDPGRMEIKTVEAR
jgi:hypothetical protein